MIVTTANDNDTNWQKTKHKNSKNTLKRYMEDNIPYDFGHNGKLCKIKDLPNKRIKENCSKLFGKQKKTTF